MRKLIKFIIWWCLHVERKPNLIAIIYGGTEVIRGRNENITMNASLSYDPVVGLGNYSGMNFTWRYGEIKGNYSGLQTAARDSFTGINLSNVHYIENDSGREVTFNAASSMFQNLTILVVKLVVAKDYRSSSDHQVIHLVKGDPPQISQRYESCFVVYQSCHLPPGLQSAFDPRSAVFSLQSADCSLHWPLKFVFSLDIFCHQTMRFLRLQCNVRL